MNNSESDVDIAIVGAGMVGLALALMLLRERRFSVALIDPQVLRDDGKPFQPSFDGRNSALAPSSVQLFEQLGLWQGMTRHAAAIAEVQVSDAGHFGWAHERASDLGMPALGYVVENSWLGRSLISAALKDKSLRVLAPETVRSAKMTAAAAELALASGNSLRARLLVLADGAESALARSLGIVFECRDFNQQAIVTNVSHSEAHRGRAFERFMRKGPLALLPRPDPNNSGLVLTRASDDDSALTMSDADFLALVQDSFGHRLGHFVDISARRHYPLKQWLAAEQVRSRLVLMGNAAHFLHPVAGQGFNLAMRDCAELATQLAGAEDPGDLRVLQRYLGARERDQQLTSRLGDLFVSTFASRNPIVAAGRNLGLLALNQRGPIKSWFFAQMMGLGGRIPTLSKS